jgi:hypothetical protein
MTKYPQAALLLTLLSGCSIYDIKQLVALPDTALLIRQHDDGHNTLDAVVARDTATHLNGVRVNPEQVPVTDSHSLAIKKNAPPISPIVTLEQAQKTLIQYVADVEEQPDRIEKLSAAAERLAQQYPDDALLQSLWQRLSRYTGWQPVNSIINSAGIDFVSIKGWQPESPFIRIRRALLPPVAETEQIIFADQRLVLFMNNLSAVTLQIDARLDDVPFLPESPTQLIYQIDEKPTQSLSLVDKANWRRFTLAIPTGEHIVRFYQQQPVGNQYIKLRFDEAGVALSVAQERPYFVSTTDAPFEFYSQGPAVLRIDELTNGNVSYRYQNVTDGWQTIRLPPTDGKSRSLFRVSQRVVNLKPEPPRNRVVQRELIPVPAPTMLLKDPVMSKKVALIDTFKLGEQEDGTLSAGLDVVRRNNQQESGATLPLEQFIQHRVNYRYFDEPNDVYWNTLGFFRVREHGNPSFGMDEAAYFNPDWLPFTVRSNAKVIAQVPDKQLEWLAQWNISIAQAYNLHPKTRLIPSLSYFARAMSLRNSLRVRADPNFKLKVDQDVFTPYKADHTQGLTPALTLEHKPWLDTVWSTKVSVGSNENLAITRPDHFATETHWQQLLGSVELDASYRMTFYQVDADRTTSSKRSYAGLGLNWQHWTSYQDRLEANLQYSYDLERRVNLGTLSFTYHFGEGRGLRDFAPNEIDFRDIRVRQIENEQNNVMRDIN